MGDPKADEDQGKGRDRHSQEKVLEKELKDTFPTSDPLASTQPSGGVTGTEPPPIGQKTGEE